MRQRHGHLDETLRDWEPGVRLFVLGRHGQSGTAGGQDLGSNVERVVRVLQRPVLTVTEGFKPPQRVLIAFDGSALTRRGVQMVADSPLLRGLPITLLMAGKLRQDGPREISWAAETLDSRRLRRAPVDPGRRGREGHPGDHCSRGYRSAGHGRLQPFSLAQPVVRQPDRRPCCARYASRRYYCADIRGSLHAVCTSRHRRPACPVRGRTSVACGAADRGAHQPVSGCGARGWRGGGLHPARNGHRTFCPGQRQLAACRRPGAAAGRPCRAQDHAGCVPAHRAAGIAAMAWV